MDKNIGAPLVSGLARSETGPRLCSDQGLDVISSIVNQLEGKLASILIQLQAQAIFTLAWFHAIVQERRVFIPQGWAKFYEFSDGDLRAGLEVLDQLSKRSRSSSNLAWETVHGLYSNAIYGGATFNEKLKKEILGQYNKRPDNINGKNIRFIILDSGFKEGIDLFDVKYVHIFEPSMTIADLKQTVGRATRTCGQKGLEFQPNIGWPLYVYNYYLTVSELTQDSMYFSKDLISNIKDNNQHLSDKEDLLLFKDVEKFNDATMLFSEFDKAMTNLSEQLFKLAPLLSVDYGLTQNLHDVDDLNSEFMEKDFYLMGGGSGAVGGASQKNPMKNVKKNTKFYNIDLIK